MSGEGQEQAGTTYETSEAKASEVAAGYFVAREDEQNRFREMVRAMIGPRRGIVGNLFGSGVPKQTSVAAPIKSRVILINGPEGIGKTRLGLRLREICQKEKEFVRRLKISRLDWREARYRDQRLAALRFAEIVPPDVALDTLFTHFVREDFAAQLNEYREALEETRQLARKVSGAELEAVWEYRARALGRGLGNVSAERPLVFIQDNCEWAKGADKWVRLVMEESGPLVIWIIIGQDAPDDYAGQIAAERFEQMQPGLLSPEELLRFFSAEMNRYNDTEGEKATRSPDQIGKLHTVTQGWPIAAKLAVFLMQAELDASDLPISAAAQTSVEQLLLEFLNGPLGAGHPDRLKLYSIALLRRPERGLLTALLDLRPDMLTSGEILKTLQARYSFLFEPLQDMMLHSAIERPLRSWLLTPERRDDEQGLGRLNRRAMGFLNERLENWGQNFPTLQSRVQEIKWREWALDKVWHAFWLGQEEGWREALPLFVAALAYKPDFVPQITGAISWFEDMGVLDKDSQSLLRQLEQATTTGPDQKTALAQIQAYEVEHGIFRQKMPRFASELSSILEQSLEQKLKG